MYTVIVCMQILTQKSLKNSLIQELRYIYIYLQLRYVLVCYFGSSSIDKGDFSV